MALIGPSGRPVTSEPAQNAASGSSPHIKDSGLATFAADVLEQSREVPVIVDFWAPWCGPCKTLGPSLEAAVEAAGGAVKLVKVNIDENPEIAQQLRIQSIPTVYAFRNGQPIDGFMGAIPDSQLRQFVQGLMGASEAAAEAAVEDALAMASEALANHDLSTAAQLFGHILQEDPGHPKAVAGLARCYLESGDLDRAKKTLGLVRPDALSDEAIRAVEAELALKERAAAAGDLAPLRAKVDGNPAD